MLYIMKVKSDELVSYDIFNVHYYIFILLNQL
jgi:hypothetical protein